MKKIADVLQQHVLPGDAFVDFACGQNSFAPLLLDPSTKQPLKSVSFDVLSPGERTYNFVCKSWFAVKVWVTRDAVLMRG